MQPLDPAISAFRTEQQRFHGERVEARQAERTKRGPTLEDVLGIRRSRRDLETEAAAEFIGGLLATAFVLDLISEQAPPKTEERIDPIDSNNPPFFRFWLNLNAELAQAGKPEATYGTARAAFFGGPTPEGTLTFVGKAFDGLRATPSTLGSYHGEYREVSAIRGTIWHTVVDAQGHPVEFASPDHALRAANQRRDTEIDKSLR